MNTLHIFQHVKISWRKFYPRYCSSFLTKNKTFPFKNQTKIISRCCSDMLLKPSRYISNYSSMQTKDTDPTSEKNDNDKMRRILEDEEFQSILKDFANDFGVDNETNELLDDIRKNIDEDYDKNEPSDDKKNQSSNTSSSILGGGLQHKYKEFSEADSTVITSNEEQNEDIETFYHIDQELKPKMQYVDLKRGVTGVFDVAELIQVLRNESLFDITAISIPKELHYADFLVLATAKSERHSMAVAESIKKLYKQKKNKKDPFVIVEGEEVAEWKAMDMGNIVLHIFLEETRTLYDIESVWLFESKYDSGGNAQQDPMLNIMEEQMEFFNSLQQSNSSDVSKDPS